MRVRMTSVVLALVMTGLPVGAWAQGTRLFDRLGGKAAISAVVDSFAARVLRDARINAKFAQSDPARLTVMLKEQICAATGGPCKYTGRSMKEAHRNMGVTEGEFGALVDDLAATLSAFKVGGAEQKELLTTLGTMKGDIVGVKGDATGTALPASFRPWKKPPD